MSSLLHESKTFVLFSIVFPSATKYNTKPSILYVFYTIQFIHYTRFQRLTCVLCVLQEDHVDDDPEQALFDHRFKLAMAHSLLPKYVKHIRETEGLSEEEWSFGVQEPTEDLDAFVDWLEQQGFELEYEMKPPSITEYDTVDASDVLGSAAKAMVCEICGHDTQATAYNFYGMDFVYSTMDGSFIPLYGYIMVDNYLVAYS